jgi:Icc-related predicted phosphoesterase
VIEIISFDDDAIHRLRYLNAARGGGSTVETLEIKRTRAAGLPDMLDAIVATSDLQGIVPDPRTCDATLLGVAVAQTLEELAFDDLLPPADRTGIVLAGDLYSVPTADKRGGFGDVASVWRAFAERFAWVAGVAGNHDDVTAVKRTDRVQLLDADIAALSGLRVGGVSLIAGNPAKHGRREEDEQLARIALVASEGVDLLILHEGPNGDDKGQDGHPGIRATIDEHATPLTICGHSHWETPLSRYPGGQILNVDASTHHNPNTNSIVALPWDFSSGERAIFAFPTGPMPEAMAMYCLPFTA